MYNKEQLQRFLDAQAVSYPVALQEMQIGRKNSHWIWFIFPQLQGLGKSSHCELYGIYGLEEAKAYLEHEVLGARLREISKALLAHKGKKPIEFMTYNVDVRKLKSSMTLFSIAGENKPENDVFYQVLETFFDGSLDKATLKLLGM